MRLSAPALKIFIEYDMKNEVHSTDMKTALKNIPNEVSQLQLDFDQLETGLQDVQVKQEQLQIRQDILQNYKREVLGLLRTR